MGRANRTWFVIWGLVLATGLGINVSRQMPKITPNRTLQRKLLLIPLLIACVSLAVSVVFLGEPGLNLISVIHWTGSLGFAIFAPWCILFLQILQLIKKSGRANKIIFIINIILLATSGLITLITISLFGMNALGQIILTLACIIILFIGNLISLFPISKTE